MISALLAAGRFDTSCVLRSSHRDIITFSITIILKDIIT